MSTLLEFRLVSIPWAPALDCYLDNSGLIRCRRYITIIYDTEILYGSRAPCVKGSNVTKQ